MIHCLANITRKAVERLVRRLENQRMLSLTIERLNGRLLFSLVEVEGSRLLYESTTNVARTAENSAAYAELSMNREQESANRLTNVNNESRSAFNFLASSSSSMRACLQ